MPKRSLAPVWKVALALVALTAMTMALFQLLTLRAGPEESRASDARMEQALTELRAEIRKEAAEEPPADQPLPNTVLRRGESGGRALQQVLDSQESQDAVLTRTLENLDRLAGQMGDSDRALRRDIEQLRAELRREREASRKTLGLLLVALVPLVVHLLASLRSRDS